MKSTTKIQISILALSAVIALVLFAVLALAPSILWTSDSDWSGGTFSNTTSINGDLQLNNTIVNGAQTIYSWLYNNWTYRKSITINGSTSLQNDYQIMIDLTNRTAGTDNFNFARANSQGNDTRFTWLNTTSGLEQNVSFWIENWTSSSSLGNATLWVNVPNVTASSVANTTLYMYYGNPSATYNNSLGGNNTFLFFDDFSGDLNKWSKTVDVSIVSGQATITGQGSWNTRGMASIATFARPVILEWSSASPTNIISQEGYSVWVLNQDSGLNLLRVNNGYAIQRYLDGSVLPLGTITYIPDIMNPVKIVLPSIGYEFYWRNTLGETNATWTTDNNRITFQVWQVSNLTIDNVRVRKYASPEPSTLSVGAEQTASQRGTYLSNTTTISTPRVSITPTWNGTNSTNVNFTVEISANNGANWLTASNNTQYTSGGGIGSGTQLKYRINFSTNDTSKTAVLSDITMNYVDNTTLTCDAGGPYLANSTVMITGNVSAGINALASQPVTVQIKNNTVVLNSTVVTSDASGNYFAKLFANTTNASSVFVNSTYSGISGNCTYSLSIQSQTIIAANATCTTNSTACSFKNYPISGWVMDSGTGSLIGSGTVKLSVKETGDTYSDAFSGGYFSISPQFCLSPGVVYSFALSIEGNGKQGFMTYRRAGKT